LNLFSPEAEAALLRLIDQRVEDRLSKHESARAHASPYLTVAEAAQYLCTTPGAIYKRVKRGQLKSYRPEGSQTLLRRDDLDPLDLAA
jgi:excisionase family DNA binding protein